MYSISKSKLLSAAAVLGLSIAASGVSASPVSPKVINSTEIRAVSQEIPRYPYRARLNQMEGSVLVEFTVAPDGSVVEPSVSESTSPIFNNAVLNVIENWKFEPVVEGEQAVPVRTGLRFNFVAQN